MKAILVLILLIGIGFTVNAQYPPLPVARVKSYDQAVRDSFAAFSLKERNLRHKLDSILLYLSENPGGGPVIPQITPFNDNNGYDSTYAVSFTQKYAIPEAVENNDVVGTWMKTYTWRSGAAVTFSIYQNHQNAFAINSSTGVITIADASKINGKVVQQDTIITLLVKSTDAVHGYELDTAYVRVKENSYCKFFDYAYSGTESGTRSQPYNDLGDPAKVHGYGYFIKRGNSSTAQTYTINPGSGTPAEANPTVIAAYGTGDKPIFDGTGLGATVTCISIGGTSSNYQIYDLEIKNYPARAIYTPSSNTMKNIGIYNMKFSGNNFGNTNINYADITFDGSAGDSLNLKNHEVRNVESTGSQGPIVYAMASGVSIYNAKTSPSNADTSGSGYTFRLGPRGKLTHFYVTAGGRGMSIIYPFITVTDGYVTGCKNAGYFAVGTSPNFSTYLTINNVHFFRNRHGVYAFDNGSPRGWVIKNSIFEESTVTGIYFNNSNINNTITRCKFIDNAVNGIRMSASAATTGHMVSYCSFFNNATAAITVANSNIQSSKFYNLTSNNAIALSTNAANELRNSFYPSVTGSHVSSNNIDTDDITTADYFNNFATGDFTLKSTATNAINTGYTTGLSYDIIGTSVPQGAGTDIGAYEYKP